MAATLGRDTNVVSALLKDGADVDAKNVWGQTSLMWAAADGNADMVRLLIRNGADARLHDGFEMTAADKAAKAGHKEIAESLRQKIQQAGAANAAPPHR